MDAMHLPTPIEHPAADVVIYDGHCRFCTNQVQKLARWDGKGRLAFLSLHDDEVAKRYPQLSYDDMMKQMYVVTPAGKQYPGAAAFRYLTRRLPVFYALAPLLHIPFSLPVWQWLYRQVAIRRYRIAGKIAEGCEGDACHVHLR
jgi:predicted DCC family thiol-disulfide oxidoreductase YuxK